MAQDYNQQLRDAAANRRLVLEQIPVDPAAGYFELRRKTGLVGADLDEALAELEGLGVIISKNTVNEALYWKAGAVPDKEWYSVEDAANYLSVSKRTVQQLIRDGEMVAYRVGQGGHRRIRRADLDGPMHREDHSGLVELAGADDPVLSELWNNDQDAAYDRL
jgi:excisionase family DNA binding protein